MMMVRIAFVQHLMLVTRSVDSYCADGNKLSNLFVVPVVNRPAL